MVVLTVFIAGLMVGRTPEYLGKKIQAREVQMAMLYVLIFPAVILTMTAVSVLAADGLKGLNNAGPARLVRDPVRVHVDRGEQRQRVRRADGHDVLLQHAARAHTLIGRFAMMVPMLALAGFLAEKKIAPEIGRHVPGDGAALRACCSSASC